MTGVVEVESGSRWDALALARRLSPGIPRELLRRISEWLEERRLPPATIRADGVSYTVEAPATPE